MGTRTASHVCDKIMEGVEPTVAHGDSFIPCGVTASRFTAFFHTHPNLKLWGVRHAVSFVRRGYTSFLSLIPRNTTFLKIPLVSGSHWHIVTNISQFVQILLNKTPNATVIA